MKTLKLISKYYKLLGEQAPEEQVVSKTAAPTSTKPEQQTGNLSDNERYVIKILTNSFIFNPSLFDTVKQKYIFQKIDEIKRMVNVPVSKIIDEIKKIISIDRSLRVESKTLSLIRKYLVEQPADATEPQNTTQTSNIDTPDQTSEQQLNGGANKLNLAEIFPLYKELILKSLKHIPTEEELMIVKPVVNEFADSDPEKIVETIQNILSQSLEDKELEDNLSNA